MLHIRVFVTGQQLCLVMRSPKRDEQENLLQQQDRTVAELGGRSWMLIIRTSWCCWEGRKSKAEPGSPADYPRS